LRPAPIDRLAAQFALAPDHRSGAEHKMNI
jgi:hypothetical protein